MRPMISVAVCTRDRPTLLQRCLASLRPEVNAQGELLVIDSAPSGREAQSIAAEAGARYTATSRAGLNVARNLALCMALGEIVAFVDDDAVVAPGWMEALLDGFADASIDCVTGRVLPLELRTAAQRYFEERFPFDRGSELIHFSGSDERPEYPVHPWQLGTGCNMAFRCQVFDQIGPFDEALDMGTPTGGGGDIDIFRRLLRAGLLAIYNPEAVVYHQHRESWAELYRQAWGYGKAFTALMTKSLLVEHDLQREAWRLTTERFHLQVRRLARRLFKRKGLPFWPVLFETLGNLAGPVAFVYSQRQVHRQQGIYALVRCPAVDCPVA